MPGLGMAATSTHGGQRLRTKPWDQCWTFGFTLTVHSHWSLAPSPRSQALFGTKKWVDLRWVFRRKNWNDIATSLRLYAEWFQLITSTARRICEVTVIVTKLLIAKGLSEQTHDKWVLQCLKSRESLSFPQRVGPLTSEYLCLREYLGFIISFAQPQRSLTARCRCWPCIGEGGHQPRLHGTESVAVALYSLPKVNPVINMTNF